MEKKWTNYFEKTRERPVREQLIKAISICKLKDNALDLGAGNLIESRFLLENGFKNVQAVDSSPDVKNFQKDINSDKLTVEIKSFKDLELPENFYDLVNAQFSLPYYGQEGFNEFIAKIIKSLKTDGVFTGQFFGEKDDWNTPGSELAFQNKDQILDLLRGTELIELNEVERDGETALGKPKHWHTFHFIVKK